MLKLSFLQGPRDGQSMEYKPGSTIRIGRVVRGNEIAIKDAGISTKHLRIESDSNNNWIIHDLGSSNGTIVNSETLDPESPVVLRHGDVIKLGELTSIVVNFVTVDVQEQEQEHKLPPRPRRNNRRNAVPDPDPDPNPTQDVPELPKRTSKTTAVEPEVKSRVTRSRKKEEIEGISKNPVKLETEDTPNLVDISATKRETRRKQNEEVETMKKEDSVVEEKEGRRRPSRSTRSKKSEVSGDPLLELDIVLKQARANKKQQTSKSIAKNDSVEAEKSEEDDAEKDEERETRTKEARKETSGDEEVDKTKVDLKTLTLGEWFDLFEVQVAKQITEETDKLLEEMRSKSRKVHEYIQEQKQAQIQGRRS